jgi:ribosomal protein L37AE/L43A
MGAVKRLWEANSKKFKPLCRECGDGFSVKRFKAGYRLCLFCGEEAATQERKSWCVAPMHKSNYVLVRDRDLLVGFNQKGGLVK